MNKHQSIQNVDAHEQRLISYKGKYIASSDFFFKDSNLTPVAIGHRGQWDFIDKAAEEKYTQLHPKSSKKPDRGDTGEYKIQKELLVQLIKQGYRARREVITKHGIIDILIESDPVKIIEVKTSSAMTDVASAVGQLFRYSADYPNAELYYYCPEEVSIKLQNMLFRRDIGLWR